MSITIYYKFDDVRRSKIGDDCRVAKLLESYCKEKEIGPLNVEILYPYMNYTNQKNENAYIIGEDIKSVMEVVPLVNKLAEEKGYENIAKETKEKSFRGEDVYRCDILSFLNKCYENMENYPSFPYRAGLVGPINTYSNGSQDADCIAYKINENGEYHFEYLPVQTNTKALLEHLDDREDELLFTGPLYVDKDFYNENKFIVNEVGKRIFNDAPIVLINDKNEINESKNSYYIDSEKDVFALYRRALDVLDYKVDVKNFDDRDGLRVAKTPIDIIADLGKQAVSGDKNSWCVVETKGEKSEYHCCFAYVDQNEKRFIWKTNVPNTRVKDVLKETEKEISANLNEKASHKERDRDFDNVPSNGLHEVVLCYDEDIQNKMDEYWKDEKDIIPYPEKEFEVFDFLNELKDYAIDHNIPFKVLPTKNFEEVSDHNKFPIFITTRENCFSPNYETDLDRCGLELYKRLYGKDFKPESLEKNSESNCKTQNPFEFLAAIDDALNRKNLSIIYECNNKNLSPVAEKMGIRYICSYVNGEECFKKGAYAITENFLNKTIDDLKEEDLKTNDKIR